jgi:hypothetical protein
MSKNALDIELVEDKKNRKWISVGYGNAHIVFSLCITVNELTSFLQDNNKTNNYRSLEVGCFGDMTVVLNIFPDDKYQILIDGPEITENEYMSFSIYFPKNTYEEFIRGLSCTRLAE